MTTFWYFELLQDCFGIFVQCTMFTKLLEICMVVFLFFVIVLGSQSFAVRNWS